MRVEFFDVGAVVYFLRKVIWTVPDFDVDRYRDRLRALHERIQADGAFVSTAPRFLIELAKPGRGVDAERANVVGIARSADGERPSATTASSEAGRRRRRTCSRRRRRGPRRCR